MEPEPMSKMFYFIIMAYDHAAFNIIYLLYHINS